MDQDERVTILASLRHYNGLLGSTLDSIQIAALEYIIAHLVRDLVALNRASYADPYEIRTGLASC
jgi:hypothetical protein